MYKIEKNFEGANINVLSVTENKAFLSVELRDTVDDWFFWCFKVENAAGKTVTFEFESPHRVGYYGAAVSYDYKNWHWQHSEPKHNGNSFTYTFKENENEVYFAHNMVYRPERFFEFASKNNIAFKTFCKSEKGRDVPYIDTEKGEECILLTARHHACESTGSYVLEGVLKTAIDKLSEKFRIICVPFVDMDGVIDGDQGKNRNGHDHNRDYPADSAAVYSSVRKIREIADQLNIRFAFDFHSPWYIGETNDRIHIPIKHFKILSNITRFSRLLENENSDNSLPHFASDDMQPGTEWNEFGVPCFGTYMGNVGAELALTLETPYFLVCDTAFSPEKAVNTGISFVSALIKYIG